MTLVHPDLGKFELQIRTHEMHEYNEYGPASHIAYKLSGKRNPSSTDKFNWVKDINFEQWKNKALDDKPIPINLFEDTVFILTPNKDIFSLPKGSTPIDFAYALHTKVGDQCIGAVVNGRPVSVDTELKTGDIVEIKTNPKKEYASKSWMEFVVTEKAKKKIMQSVNRRLYKM